MSSLRCTVQLAHPRLQLGQAETTGSKAAHPMHSPDHLWSETTRVVVRPMQSRTVLGLVGEAVAVPYWRACTRQMYGSWVCGLGLPVRQALKASWRCESDKSSVAAQQRQLPHGWAPVSPSRRDKTSLAVSRSSEF